MTEPPVHIKARYVLLWLIPALLIGIVPLAVVRPEWFTAPAVLNELLIFAMLIVGIEGSWFALTAIHAHLAGVSIVSLFRWSGIKVWRLVLMGLPMIASAIVCVYVLFAPLSLVFPDGVQWWLFEEQPVLYGPAYPLLENIAGFVAVCLVAPIAEEWIFRGLLLRRWAAKVGAFRAVVRTSLLFCLMHTDLLGSLLFAVTTAGLYAWYRTLWAPILLHMANNTLAFVAAVVIAHTGLEEASSVEELRAQWWLPLIAAISTLPWLMRVRKTWVPISQWQFEPAPRQAPMPAPPDAVLEGETPE